MKTALLATALMLTTVGAYALDPIIVDSRNMNCTDVQRVLRSEGVVLIEGRWGLETHYSRIPNCELGWKYEWTYVPSANTRYCAAGYTCQPDYSGGN